MEATSSLFIPLEITSLVFSYYSDVKFLAKIAQINKYYNSLISHSLRYKLLRIPASANINFQLFHSIVQQFLHSSTTLDQLDSEVQFRAKEHRIAFKQTNCDNAMRFLFSQFEDNPNKEEEEEEAGAGERVVTLDVQHPLLQYLFAFVCRYFDVTRTPIRHTKFQSFPWYPRITRLAELIRNMNEEAEEVTMNSNIQELLTHPMAANARYYLLRGSLLKTLWSEVTSLPSLWAHRDLLLFALRNHRNHDRFESYMEKVPPEYFKDEEVLEEWICCCPMLFPVQHIPDGWTTDKQRCKRILQKNVMFYRRMHPALQNDIEIVLWVLKCANEEIVHPRDTISLLLPALKLHMEKITCSIARRWVLPLAEPTYLRQVLSILPADVFEDEEVALHYLTLFPSLYDEPKMPEHLFRTCRKLALFAAKNIFSFFRFHEVPMQKPSFHTVYGNDDEIVNLVLQVDVTKAPLCHPRFLTTQRIMEVAQRTPSSIDIIPPEHRYTPLFIKYALQNASGAHKLLRGAPEHLKKDVSFIKRVMGVSHDAALRQASPELLTDKSLCLYAISVAANAIKYFEAFQDDEEVAKAALDKNVMAYNHLSKRLQRQLANYTLDKMQRQRRKHPKFKQLMKRVEDLQKKMHARLQLNLET